MQLHMQAELAYGSWHTLPSAGILYRQSPDAVLEFHDPSDYACYVCTVWETRNIWCLSALP